MLFSFSLAGNGKTHTLSFYTGYLCGALHSKTSAVKDRPTFPHCLPSELLRPAVLLAVEMAGQEQAAGWLVASGNKTTNHFTIWDLGRPLAEQVSGAPLHLLARKR